MLAAMSVAAATMKTVRFGVAALDEVYGEP
jgi:hypothetical protein